MNGDSIELLPEEMRKKRGEAKKEEKKRETSFVMPEKEGVKVKPEETEKTVPRVETKKKSGFFNVFKRLFRSSKKVGRKEPFSAEASTFVPRGGTLADESADKKAMEDKEKEALRKKEKEEREGKEKTKEIKKEEKGKMKMPTEIVGAETLEISLMPEKIVITPKLIKKKIFILIRTVIICGLVVFGLFLMLNKIYQNKLKKAEFLRQEIKKADTAISDYSDMVFTVKNLEDRTAKIKKLLDNHIYFSKFFSALERYTLPEIYYLDLSLDTSGKVVLPAMAKDLSSLLKQMTIFQNAPDFIKEIKFSGFNIIQGTKDKQGGLSFRIELILIDDFFIK